MSEHRRTTRPRAVVVLLVGFAPLFVLTAACTSAKPIPPVTPSDFGTLDRITSPSTVIGAPVTTRAPIVTTAPSTVPPITGITIPNITSATTDPAAITTIATPAGTVAPPITNIAPSPEDPAIFAAYRAFWDAYLWSASHPSDPRWDQLRAVTSSATLDSLRQQLEERFSRGESLRVGDGVSLNPVILDHLDSFHADLSDCITDGTYWIATSTGEPLPDEITALHTSQTRAFLFKQGKDWLVGTASNRVETCGA